MSKKTAGRKKRIIITTAAMLAIGGGAAFAYWSAFGTGSVQSKPAAGSKEFTFTIDPLSGHALAPNGPTQTANFTVNNPGTGAQMVNSVTVVVANDDGSNWMVNGCSKADFEVTTTFEPANIPAGGSKEMGHVSLRMKDTGENQDGCQGVVVPLHFAAS